MKKLKNKIAVMLATWFYVGLIPFAPGTFGSLFALPLAFVILKYLGVLYLIIASLLIFLIGIRVSSISEQVLKNKDPKLRRKALKILKDILIIDAYVFDAGYKKKGRYQRP